MAQELPYTIAMYRRFGLLYTIFSILVLAALVVLLVVRVNTIREFNLQDAQTSFIRLQGRVRGALLADDSADLGPVVRAYAEQVPTALAIVIYDPEAGFKYIWTSQVDVLAFARSDIGELRGFPAYDLREVSQVKVSGRLEGVGQPRLYIDGVYRVLDYADAYAPLRDSLIALLAFALLTVFVALAVGLSRRDRGTGRSATVGDTPRAADPSPVSDATPRETLDSGWVNERRSPAAGAERPSQPGPASTHGEPLLEEVDIEEIATDPGEPGTLFSPVTNLSFRDHLEKRLGLELERAAFNDQDLTCMLVRFPDAATGGENYSVRAGQVLSAFKFEDLCFEYNKDTFCVILPNTELSRGLREAEAFKSDHKGKTYFGMSARNGRLVESSRVLGEAARSLEHAEHEPGGIVGFQPDPKKYRQFVTRTSGCDD